MYYSPPYLHPPVRPPTGRPFSKRKIATCPGEDVTRQRPTFLPSFQKPLPPLTGAGHDPRCVTPSPLLFSLFRLRCVSRGQVTTKCFLRYRLPPITDGPPLLSFVLAREIHLPSRRPNSHSLLSIGPEGWKGRENANNACLPTEEWIQSGKDGGWTDGGGRFSSVPTPITSEHILSIKSSWHVLT